MAKATITLTDRDDREGVDFTLQIEPEPNANLPPTAVEAVAFDIVRRLREMERESEYSDDDATDIDDPTDLWGPT